MIQTISRTLLLLLLATSVASAQVVRGTVTERNSGAPVPGVLISISPVSDAGTSAPTAPQAGLSALTNDQGEYAIRAPAPGRYRVSAKRIGVQRTESEVFTLAAGETHRVDLTLSTVSFTLPEVRVAAEAMCIPRTEQVQRVSALWDEARTALTATQVSLRDRLFRAHISQYIRELDPRNLRVQTESRSERRGVMDRPVYSLSGDSLSKVGYWYVDRQGYRNYFAPDAEVLLSREFVRDHCFFVAPPSRARRGLVGVAFEPAPSRSVGEITGTLWLEDRTFHLRLVEFKYTSSGSVDNTQAGGEVHFARLPSGAWIVRKWFFRMPSYGRSSSGVVGVEGRIPSVMLRPSDFRLLEEGGDVYAEGLRLFERPGVLTGTVTDSAGRPMPSVTLSLSTTPFTTRADSTGAFRFDSLPAGRFTLVAEHPDYASLGTMVDDAIVETEEGATREVRLRAIGTVALVQRLCEGKRLARGRAALRVVLADSTTANPLTGLAVRLRWALDTVSATNALASAEEQMRDVTDGRGAAVFCDVPAGRLLELGIVRTGLPPLAVATFRLGDGEVVGRTVRARRPR